MSSISQEDITKLNAKIEALGIQLSEGSDVTVERKALQTMLQMLFLVTKDAKTHNAEATEFIKDTKESNGAWLPKAVATSALGVLFASLFRVNQGDAVVGGVIGWAKTGLADAVRMVTGQSWWFEPVRVLLEFVVATLACTIVIFVAVMLWRLARSMFFKKPAAPKAGMGRYRAGAAKMGKGKTPEQFVEAAESRLRQQGYGDIVDQVRGKAD